MVKRKILILSCLFLIYFIFHFIIIFSNQLNFNQISFLFTGDFIPHDSVRKLADKFGYEYFFVEFLNFFKNNINYDDYKNINIFYNLETPILYQKKPFQSFIFSEEIRLPQSLAKINFNNISIANNHILDWEYDGFISTIEQLNNLKNYYNINFSGYIIKRESQEDLFINSNKVSIEEKNKISEILNKNYFNFEIIENYNIKICFISVTLIMNNINEWKKIEKDFAINKNIKYIPAFIPINNYKYLLSKENIYLNLFLNQINKLKEIFDLIILGIHWGNEYKESPQNYQIELSKIFIDNGVDIIWGHHSHIPGKIMIYKNKPVIFSNGNLFSGQARFLSFNSNNNVHKNYFYTKSIPVYKITFFIEKNNYQNFENKNNFKIYLKNIIIFPFYQLNDSFSSKLIIFQPSFEITENEKSNYQISKNFIKKQFFDYIFINNNKNTNEINIKEILKIENIDSFELNFIYP